MSAAASCLLTPNLVYDEASSSCKRKPELQIRLTTAQEASIFRQVVKEPETSLVFEHNLSFRLDVPNTWGLESTRWGVNCSSLPSVATTNTPTAKSAVECSIIRFINGGVQSDGAQSQSQTAVVEVRVNASGLPDSSVTKTGPKCVFPSLSGKTWHTARTRSHAS